MANVKEKLKTPPRRAAKLNRNSVNKKTSKYNKPKVKYNGKILRSSKILSSEVNNDASLKLAKERCSAKTSNSKLENMKVNNSGVTDSNRDLLNKGNNKSELQSIAFGKIQRELQKVNGVNKRHPENKNDAFKLIQSNKKKNGHSLPIGGTGKVPPQISDQSDRTAKITKFLRQLDFNISCKRTKENNNTPKNYKNLKINSCHSSVVTKSAVTDIKLRKLRFNLSTQVGKDQNMTSSTASKHIVQNKSKEQNVSYKEKKISEKPGKSLFNTISPNDSVKSNYKENGIQNKPNKLMFDKKRRNRSSRKHVCEVCSKAFYEKNDLRKHFMIHTDVKPFSCPHCEKDFRQAGNLKTHVLCRHSAIVDTAEVYLCNECNKPFTIKERLRLHLRTHMGDKPFECKQCGRKFARKGEVRQHIRTHTGERNYECMDCHTLFSCKAKLVLHIKSHMGIRDFTCYLCGKTFLRPDAFKKHIACYHFNEKPFECPVCKKKLKGHLKEHMRTHMNLRPHICKVCKLQFTQRSHLTVHERTHSGERPYKCRVCRRSFAHSTALTLHTRRHTGEKPIKCPICPASFAQLPHMKKHMLNIHNERLPYRCKKCKAFFRTKMEMESHYSECSSDVKPKSRSLEEELSARVAAAHAGVEPAMALSRMRFLLAILLKKISSDKNLEVLGFNKRLIDDILIESLESSGHKPCKDQTFPESQRLKTNVQMLLDWTVPTDFKQKFRNENKSTEELLEQLTS